MEQPTAETPRQGNNNDAQSSMGQATFPFDNWATMDNIFPELDVQTQDSQMAAAHQQQAPQGITWDHPIFSHASQDHGRQASFSQQDDHLRDFYAGTPQAWGQTTSTPQTTANGVPGQTYGLSHEHPYPLQPQIRHDQVSFDARTISPENLAAYQYSISPGHYYQQPGLQPADAYNQHQQQQQHRHQPIAPRPAPTPQQTMLSAGTQSTHNNRYVVPASNVTGNTQARSFHDYGDGNSSINYQNTIDPQFLSTLQDAANITPQSSQNQFLFYNPNASSYERPNDPKAYQAFPENLSNLNAEQLNARQHIGPGLMGQLPQLTPFPTGAGMITSNGQQKPLTPQTISPAKKPRGRPKKNLPNTSNAKARSESISGSSDSELEFEEPDEPSPLPAVRPADDEGAIQYDTIKAVWSPRNKYPSVDKIKNALVAFKDVVKAVRDEWKSLSQSMKDAENQNNNEKALELKNKVAHQRKLINTVISTTIEKGHPVIVEKLGEHPMAVAALYSFLLDRHQASDYEGVLLVNILTLLSRFTTMDDDVLLKTNVSKLLPRIIKKGIQPGKDLAQKILDNAAQSTKRKQESSGSSPGRDAVPDKPGEASSNGGLKRIRDGETNGLPATKKIVTPATAAAKGSSATKMVNSSSAVKAADGKPNAAASAARPKANIVPPKPTSLFGSLTSASKKPGTSNAARAAAAAAAAKEKGHNASERKDSPQPAPAKPAFSFGDILADLNKKEEANVKKPSENNPSETEEERQKRLRKEARRRLRVSWKPDDSLTEIRIFTHDPDEVVGLGDDLKRDVDDIKGEGRMLKLHKDLDEDDEEEVEPQEEEMHPWTNLLLVDQDLSSEDQSNNFIKRGGTKEPDSPEKLAQENREATTLMVFYTSAADVPTSPKEPPAAADDEPVVPELPFGEPDDKVKARSARYFAMFNPQPVPTPVPAPAVSAAPVTPAVQSSGPLDIANLLKVIQSAPQQARSTPPPVPPPQPAQNLPNPLANLEQTINMFRQQQQQQPVQPVMPHIPQIPQLPVVPPIPQVPISAPSGQPIDLQKILAVLNAQKQLAQPQPPVVPQMPAAQPGIAPNLAALVSQLSGNRIGTPVAQQQQQQQQQPPHQSSSGVYEDPERKRYRDMGNAHDNTGFGQQQGNAKRPRMYVDPEAKKHPRAGSVACRFWREGKCLKGEDCTFRHDPADLI